jgi:beta-glucanase (GH16 family)
METGGNGWGNNELETYTNRTQNAHVQDGNLVITANKETFTGSDGITRQYTSARLKTASLFEQKYGRFEARIKITFGQGMWPAFWMLGNNIGTAGWPSCGEIDIMENIGKEPSIVHGTIHGPGYSGANGLGGPYTLPSGKFADDFHIFAIEWEASALRFYVDGNLYETRTPADLPAGKTWVFDHPFFILLNVAVGGDWPGNPDNTTVFPQNMLVDYVRVYAKK